MGAYHTVKIVSLSPAFEPIFWNFVKEDIPHYFFFAFDWKYNKEATEILLALDGRKIEGMMLIYRENIVHLRGRNEAVKSLLERLDLEEVELQAEMHHRECVLERYTPIMTCKMNLMILNKEEGKLQPRHSIMRLEASDAEEIAALMRRAYPERWGAVTCEQIVKGIHRGVNWFGIRVDGKLVSIGSINITEWAGLIGRVATHEAYRNRGYATSIVSELANQIFKEAPIAIIYVLSDNKPAIRAYEKAGFKRYQAYFFMRGQRITKA